MIGSPFVSLLQRLNFHRELLFLLRKIDKLLTARSRLAIISRPWEWFCISRTTWVCPGVKQLLVWKVSIWRTSTNGVFSLPCMSVPDCFRSSADFISFLFNVAIEHPRLQVTIHIQFATFQYQLPNFHVSWFVSAIQFYHTIPAKIGQHPQFQELKNSAVRYVLDGKPCNTESININQHPIFWNLIGMDIYPRSNSFSHIFIFPSFWVEHLYLKWLNPQFSWLIINPYFSWSNPNFAGEISVLLLDFQCLVKSRLMNSGETQHFFWPPHFSLVHHVSCWKIHQTFTAQRYMLNDKALLVNRFISVPKDLGDVNCGAFLGKKKDGDDRFNQQLYIDRYMDGWMDR